MKIVDICNLNIDFNSGKYKDFNEFLQVKARIDFILKREGVDNLPPEPIHKFGAVFYDFKLYVAKPEYETIKSELMLLADRFTHYYYYEFSKAEVNESPLFMVSMESYIPEDKSPSFLGTEYIIEDICNVCGLKKKIQLNELHIDTSIMKNKKFLYEPVPPEGGDIILISNDFLSVIQENNLTGFELKPVVHVGKENKKVEIHQLIPTNILPPVQPINIIL